MAFEDVISNDLGLGLLEHDGVCISTPSNDFVVSFSSSGSSKTINESSSEGVKLCEGDCTLEDWPWDDSFKFELAS